MSTGVAEAGSKKGGGGPAGCEIHFSFSYILNPLPVSRTYFNIRRRHRRRSSSTCVPLGQGKIGGAVEDTSVPILMLRLEKINNIYNFLTSSCLDFERT